MFPDFMGLSVQRRQQITMQSHKQVDDYKLRSTAKGSYLQQKKFFFPTSGLLWDLSSWIRDQTWVMIVKARSPKHWTIGNSKHQTIGNSKHWTIGIPNTGPQGIPYSIFKQRNLIQSGSGECPCGSDSLDLKDEQKLSRQGEDCESKVEGKKCYPNRSSYAKFLWQEAPFY